MVNVLDFEAVLVSAAQAVLANTNVKQRFCDPVTEVDSSRVGAHLNQNEKDELDKLLINQVRSIALAVHAALARKLIEIPNRDMVIAVNERLNAAHGDPNALFESDVGVQSGLIDAFTEISRSLLTIAAKLYGKIINDAPHFYSLFDIRLETAEQGDSMVLVVEKLLSEIRPFQRIVRKFDALHHLQDGGDALNKNFEERENYYRAEILDRTGIDISEFLSRAKLLLDDFEKLILCLDASPNDLNLQTELAVHYFQVIHMFTNNLMRDILHFNNERESSGFSYAKSEGFPEIYMSYEERLSNFLAIFRRVIVGMNALQRTLLLLECRKTDK